MVDVFLPKSRKSKLVLLIFLKLQRTLRHKNVGVFVLEMKDYYVMLPPGFNMKYIFSNRNPCVPNFPGLPRHRQFVSRVDMTFDDLFFIANSDHVFTIQFPPY